MVVGGWGEGLSESISSDVTQTRNDSRERPRETILSRGDEIRGAERGEEWYQVWIFLRVVHLCWFLPEQHVSQSITSSHLIHLRCSE